MEWTLEQELERLFDCKGIDGAFACLGFGHCANRTLEYGEWQQGGSECYTYAFRVVGCHETRHLLLKAFVPFFGTISPTEAASRHMSRSALLSQNGVPVPKVLAGVRGTVLMEFVPHDLADFLAGSLDSEERLVQQTHTIEAKLLNLGFSPVKGGLQYRTDGRVVYLVDLGTDLG